jgi:hypothetical protein
MLLHRSNVRGCTVTSTNIAPDRLNRKCAPECGNEQDVNTAATAGSKHGRHYTGC